MPDSMSNCGELNAPALTMISARASAETVARADYIQSRAFVCEPDARRPRDEQLRRFIAGWI